MPDQPQPMPVPPTQPKPMDPDALSYDFEHAINAPNATAMVQQLLQGEIAKQNTMQIEEFSRYERLFQYDGMSMLGEYAYKMLMEEYFSKISVYDPVTVMDGNKVLFTLPPIFQRYNPLSTIGQIGADVNQAFINMGNNDDPFSQKKLYDYGHYYGQLVGVANSSQQHEANVAAAKEMADKALAATKLPVPPPVPPEAAPEHPSETPAQPAHVRTIFKDGKLIQVSDTPTTTPEHHNVCRPL